MKDEQIYDIQGLGNSSDKVNLSNVSVARHGQYLSVCLAVGFAILYALSVAGDIRKLPLQRYCDATLILMQKEN